MRIASRKQLVARKMRQLNKISASHLNHSESNLMYFLLFKEKQLGAALEKVHLLGVLGVLDREGLAAHDLWGSESNWGCISCIRAMRRFPPSRALIPFPAFDTWRLLQMPRALQGPDHDWGQNGLGLCCWPFPLKSQSVKAVRIQ